MMVEQGFLDQRGISGYDINKQFFSKKNRVYLVKGRCANGDTLDFVLKEYNVSGSSMQKEANFLEGLHREGVDVPQLYYRGERSIIMEYIRGATLIDTMTDVEYIAGKSRDYINVKGIATHLARWLDSFYRAAEKITGKNTILWDINLRNFLVDFKLYGIDFENCREGAVEEDAGRLMAFIVTYEPAFTPFKIQFAQEICNALKTRISLDRKRIAREVLKEFDAIEKRRDMEIPEGIIEQMITEDLAI